MKTKTTRPWGSIFLGAFLTGSGGYAVDRAIKMEDLHKDRGAPQYSLYRTTEDPAEPARLRKKVQYEDGAVARCQAAMAAGGIITIIGLYELFLTGKEVLDYSMAYQPIESKKNRSYWLSVDLIGLST